MELEEMRRMLADSEVAYTVFADRVYSITRNLRVMDEQIGEAEERDDSQRLIELSGQLKLLSEYMENVRAGIRQRMSMLDGLSEAFQRLAGNTQRAQQQLIRGLGKRYGAASIRSAERTASYQQEACIQGSSDAEMLKEKFASLLQEISGVPKDAGMDARAAGREWTESLSEEERCAVRAYTGSAYENINGVLRGKIASFAPGNEERAFQLHQALSRARLPQECVVYRGASAEALGAYKDLADQELIGKRIYDDGFMSTSLNKEDSFGGEVKLCITAPKGSNGAYVGYAGSYGHQESEVLFCDGQIMKVTGVTRDMSGRRIIHARIMLGGNEDGKI